MVRVADGDTITVLTAGNMQEKIRFHGIDAPEKDQAFGQKSKQRLSDYVFGKDVTVTWKSKDKYGRILGTVWLGSTDINLQMLRDGYAWHYKRFDSNPTYAAAELVISPPESAFIAIKPISFSFARRTSSSSFSVVR